MGAIAGAGYPSEWESDVVLSHGGTVHVRPISPEDGDRLQALHGRLSRDTIYLRYFSPRPTLSNRDVERFTHVDYQSRMALVAVLGADLVGMASYDRWPGRTDADVAFVVDDAHQGKGIGTVLLEHLGAAARQRGITGFTATVLPANARMRSVFRSAGFEVTSTLADGLIEVTLGIEPSEATRAAIEDREQVAAARSVARLLAPRSIAVVGAGREPGTLGHDVFVNLVGRGFRGGVHPVNRRATEVAGRSAVSRVTDIAGDIDLAVIAVPAAEVPAVVEDCAAKQVGGLVVLTAGFADAGPAGAALERDLVEQAHANGMRLIGPNCMGVLNTAPDVRLHATFAPVAPPPGVVGLVSQSGPLGIGILAHFRHRGLGLSTFAAVGNRADVSSNDLLQFWEGDDRTQVVLLYLESFGNPATFSRLARRLSRVKPIVAVKAGRAGGSEEVAADALFRQTGVIRVDGLEALFDTAQLLVEQPLPAGRRVAVVAHAGSALLAVDACLAAGLELARLSSATEAALAGPAGAGGSTANPVELAHPAGPPELEEVVRAVLDDPGVDAVLSVFLPPSAAGRAEVGPALERASAGRDKPVLSIFFGGSRPPGSTVSTFEFPEEAARALGRVADHAAWRRRPAGVVPSVDDADIDSARALVEVALGGGGGKRGRLDLDTRLALLASFRISVAATRRAGTVEEAVAGATAIGLPVALKAGGLNRPGRTEAGGVAVDLQSLDEVAAAWGRMSASLGPSLLPASVQEMVASGVDLIVRVVQDPTFGPIISLGLGGAVADAMAAGPPHILPLTDVDVGEVVASSPAAGLLFGVDGGGAPPVDTDSLVDLLLRVSALVVAVPELAELRLNPVIVSTHGTAVVDVDAVVAPVLPPEPNVRRIR